MSAHSSPETAGPAALPLAIEDDGTSPAPGVTYSRRAAVSWILYDTANTLFSYAVITRYFNDWILVQQGRPDWNVGVMNLLVSLALVISLPLVGAFADVTGRRKPLLAGFTALCALMTAALGIVSGMPWTLVVAGIALFAYNSALAHYDPLLAAVAPPERQSRISGIGVAAGYVGVMAAIFVLGAIVHSDNQAAFIPTAIAFGVLALPALVFIREPGERRRVGAGELPVLAREAFVKTLGGLRRARHSAYGRFLVARFFYIDALATVIAFIAVYAQRSGGLNGSDVDLLLSLSIVFAVSGALMAGFLAERFRPRPVIIVTVAAVAVVLAATGAVGGATFVWLAAPVVGAGLGAVTTADRVLVLRLTAEHERGEVFGLYALVGRLSSGVGPFLLWGGTIWLVTEALELMSLADAGRVALVSLAAAAAIGALLMRGVPDSR